ncbi:MAG: hypothetical protein QNK37_38815 [Acidobacteriota bacterium]|nr:hypothetical protein [Acidobacteriota bacterium]
MKPKLALTDLSVKSFTTKTEAVVGGLYETQECPNDTWTALYHMCPGPSGQEYCTWEAACR